MSEENWRVRAMPEWITSRRLSLLILLIYLTLFTFAALGRPPGEVFGRLLMIFGYFILPLACIWYGDEMGDYVGTLPGPAINRRTPGWMVKLGGWFLLLLPAIIVSLALLFS
jgi:hypothetical protein